MLEAAFEHELQELQLQQEAELAAVEEGLRKGHLAETEHLREEHRSEMEELRTQQQEQVRERHHGSFFLFHEGWPVWSDPKIQNILIFSVVVGC